MEAIKDQKMVEVVLLLQWATEIQGLVVLEHQAVLLDLVEALEAQAEVTVIVEKMDSVMKKEAEEEEGRITMQVVWEAYLEEQEERDIATEVVLLLALIQTLMDLVEMEEEAKYGFLGLS
jgi:hypothetical protein